jgi:hypothetical protein
MADRARAGLCETCAHLRLVSSDRGVVFYLCEYSKRDPSYPKYPAIPVLSCAAYSHSLRESRDSRGQKLG